MLPSAITLWNYRSFPGPVRLELRPVTLLFGDNNSGKSALLRALRLLADAETVAAPLNLDSRAARGSVFKDLLWKGVLEDDDPDLGISLLWEASDEAERLEYRMAWFEEWKRIIVRRFSIWEAGDRLALEAKWIPSPVEQSAHELTYEIQTPENETPIVGRLGFFGLAPASSTLALSPLNAAESQISLFAGEVQWLTAVRRLPERIYPYPGTPRSILEPDGRDAPAVLAGRPDLLEVVSLWYERNLRRRLRVQEVDQGLFRLNLQHLDRAALDTNLVENGEGTNQVLPVLTALALNLQREGPLILTIEEPESHLHPSLQRALAEHICEVAAATPSSRIVLETHSEHMLLGVQLAILKGLLRPEDVLLYWVRQLENGESVADPVTFDEDARQQGGWPPGVFSQDTEMAREIIQKRRERAQD